MAKKKGSETKDDDRSGRKPAPIQVDKDLARMVAVVAAHDGVTQGQLIEPVLRPFMLAQYARVQNAIKTELADQPAKPV